MRTRRSSDVLVSTTEELDGWEVTEYLDVVSAHVVAGTNFFSDVAASFSDVFGGRSGSYKRQLEDINEKATEELKEKAAQPGARRPPRPQGRPRRDSRPAEGNAHGYGRRDGRSCRAGI
jgi:hypothetical protein